MAIHVGLFLKSEAEQADEMFVTNAIQELVPLSAVGDRSLPGASGVYYKNYINYTCRR